MKKFNIKDYPKLQKALRDLRRWWQLTDITHREFAQVLVGEFKIPVEISANDTWGSFWVPEDQAVLFVLKWS